MQVAPQVEPIVGTPVRFPPGRVRIRLTPEHRNAYRRLYKGYQTILAGLPVLREDRDFEGRAVMVTESQLEALNAAFSKLGAVAANSGSPFQAQEKAKSRLFKRLQHLS